MKSGDLANEVNLKPSASSLDNCDMCQLTHPPLSKPGKPQAGLGVTKYVGVTEGA